MAKRGRPRGLTINPMALDDLIRVRCTSRADACAAAGITPSHLADAASDRSKGLSPESVRLLAEYLHCHPATLAPELLPRFVALRQADEVVEVAS